MGIATFNLMIIALLVGIGFLGFWLYLINIVKRFNKKEMIEKLWEFEKDFFLEDFKKRVKDLSVSVLITAYNEEKSIKSCIETCLNQIKKPDEIIVVNDGSTDRTLDIVKSFGEKIRIINLEKNTGNKSKAQEVGLKYVKTDIFVTTDADTRLDKNFIKEVVKTFSDDSVSAVCGFVESVKDNWITKVREINYLVGQTLYKKAQQIMDAIVVIPGCSAAFRTKDFRESITFDHDNITEDLDFTYKLKLANKKIIYNDRAIVYTQDPNNLKSYFKQMYRWYSGGWTCLKKNFKILKKPNNALILSPLYLEGLIMGGIFMFAPLLIFFGIGYFLYFLALQFMVNTAVLSYGAFKLKRYEVFFYIPHHYFMSLAEKGIFVFAFIKEFVFNKKNLAWQRADRY